MLPLTKTLPPIAPKPPLRPRATELEWLRWFAQNADFGPADSDVRANLKKQFMDKTKKNLPEGWNFGPDGETIIDRP